MRPADRAMLLLRLVLSVLLMAGLLPLIGALLLRHFSNQQSARDAVVLYGCVWVVGGALMLALALRGLPDGVAALVGALRRAPTQADIEAVAVIADETLMVELGKSARAHPALAPQIIDALDSLEAPRASLIATGLRRDLA